MYKIYNEDCMDWISKQSDNSIHAVVTDPPYAIVEYSIKEIEKMRLNKGGIWRLPPSFDGSNRQPLPRFSVINDDENARNILFKFFKDWGSEILRIMTPGSHLMIASTQLLSDILSCSLRTAGFERRGEIVRLVKTFRGGDRPKGAEQEYPEISVSPRAAWEPWGIYRKPCSEKTIAQNLRRWGTGGLRRISVSTPFLDVIECGRTSKAEKILSGHPSQKPLELMMFLTKSALPLGKGIILDPFMGSGTTIAAAEFQGLNSIGVEREELFFTKARESIANFITFLKNKHQSSL